MSQRRESASTPQTDGFNSSRAKPSAAQQIAGEARDMATEAKRQAEGLYRETSSGAADASDALDATAEALADSGHETLSQVAASISDRVRTFSTYLENRDLDELIGDARRLAQRNPALFVAGGVALGFTLSRFLKASGGSGRMGS